MSRQKKNRSKKPTTLEKLLLATAILNLVKALIDFISSLTE